ncbi:MAG: type II secretion system F family protein [Chloroflexi bacterium]|nr:type II secretion system F family protein [Chloroflexota bacterium]
MRFQYVAYNLKQGVIKGQIDARAPGEAQAQLRSQGLKPLKLKELPRQDFRARIFPSFFRVKTGEIIHFCRNTATMLTTGGNLVRVLEMFQRETRSPMMRRTLEDIRHTLDDGGSFSEALATHPTVFGPLFISVVEVGEHTGRLGPALEEMADILHKEDEAKQKAIRTLMYPVAIIGLAVLVLVILMLFALPPMLKVFERMGDKLPLVTRVTIAFFNQVREHFVIIAISLVVLIVFLALIRRIPRVRFAMDHFQAKVPIVGSLIVAKEMSRFSRTLAMLLDSSVPLASALQLSLSGCHNLPLRTAFEQAEEHLLSGRPLAESLREHPIIPSLFVEMVAIGEESNSLPRTMKDAASAYQNQLDQRLSGILGMLEPLSTIFVGGIVALIAFSMFLPIYASLNSFG